MGDINIYAIIATNEHTNEQVNAGNALLLRAKDEKEQQALMREVALAVRGDVVKLSNGLFLIVTADR